MIDPSTEKLIPLLDTKKLVPVSTPTLRRWAKSGRLEAVKAGRRIFTSAEAVRRLLQQGPQLSHGEPSPTQKQLTQRQKQIDREWEALMGSA